MRFVKQDKIFRENKLPERPPYAILHLMMLTRGFFALILAAVVSGLSLSAARAGETPDPRVRAYVDPVRVVWQTEARARDDGWPARARVEGAARLLAPKFGQVCEGPFGKAGGARLANGGEDAGLMLDFGRELHGGLQLGVSPGGTARARLRVRFGESVAEAMSSVGERGASNDHALRDFTVEVPSFGTLEVGCTGFRFVRLDLVSGGEVGLEFVRAVSLMRPMRRVGSFRSSDGRLDRVFETAVRTVHLCCQDYLWDGIKRDRLVWVGDMHPEMAVILNVFGAAEVVPRSLEYAIAVTPPDRWMNTMAPYTLWFVRNLAAWCRYTGRADLLRRHAAYFRATLAHVATAVSPDGEWTAGKFLDWPNQRNPEAVAAGMQGLLALACDDAADLLGRLGDGGEARAWRGRAEAARRVRADAHGSKAAVAMLALGGCLDPQAAFRDVLGRDGHRGVSTFYGYYMLEAMSLAGEGRRALDTVRDYWGGMLDVGATSFWENFDLAWTNGCFRIDELPVPGKRDVHGDCGEFCYPGFRHSLCHGWAGGPAAWCIGRVLGIRPVADGCRRVEVRPCLGDLAWAEGAMALPDGGAVRVRAARRADGTLDVQVEAPDGVEVVR